MDGHVGRVTAPLLGLGSLIGSLAAWAADDPLWASVLLVVALVTLAVPVVLFLRLAKRVVADALERGTSLDMSYPPLRIHVGRNATPRSELPPTPKDDQ